MKITIDFESRSKVDIKTRGLMPYATSDTTEIICCAIKIENSPTEIWISDRFINFIPYNYLENLPVIGEKEFKELIEYADIIEAHNVNFERNMYRHQLHIRRGWPLIPDSKWRCSAAKASVFALPRSLEGVSSALDLDVQKDKEGHRIMLKVCKPRKPTKNNPSIWHEEPEDYLKLFNYCIRDVDTEYAVSESLREMKPEELKVWQLDQIINNRGIHIDLDLCEKAIELVAEHEAKLMEELSELTEGEVTSPKQRDKLLEFLNKELEK